MIPNAEPQHQGSPPSAAVRYPAWYPWFLRGNVGLPQDRGGDGLQAHPVENSLAVRVRKALATERTAYVWEEDRRK